MSTRTTVRVDTYTQSVTYVVGGLLDLFRTFVDELGLAPDYFAHVLEVLEAGLLTWIEGRYLRTAYLEVYSPSGSLVTRIDIDIDYKSSTSAHHSFCLDLFLAKLMAKKVGSVSRSCKYRVVVTTAPGAPSVPGWSSTKLLSSEGLSPWHLGEALGSPDIGSSMQLWLR